MPFLLVLTAFGAYTAHNSLADIVVMLGATAVGVAAIRWDWPRAPLLLALVLGDIAERYLFLSYSLYEWTWVTRPLVIAFAAITLRGRGVVRSSGRTATCSTAPRSARADLAITLAFLVVAVAVLLEARAWPFRTSVFPLATGLAPARPRAAEAGSRRACPQRSAAPPPDDDAGRHRVLVTAGRAEWLPPLGWMAAFFVMLWLLGALITVPLFTLVYLLLASRESPVLAGACALASWVFIYGLFDRLLRIPLP